jgi:hypothetical protein
MAKVLVLFICLFCFTDHFSMIRETLKQLIEDSQAFGANKAPESHQHDFPISSLQINQIDDEHQSMPSLWMHVTIIAGTLISFEPYRGPNAQLITFARHRPPRVVQ